MASFFFKIVGLFMLLCVLFACEPTTDAQKEPASSTVEEAYQLPETLAVLYTTVGAKHDTAMLLMSDIERAKHALRGRLPTLKEGEKEPLLTALTALNKAGEGMMTWMREFKGLDLYEEDYRVMSVAEIEAYLQAEEAKIEQVHVAMSNSIANARVLLEANNE